MFFQSKAVGANPPTAFYLPKTLHRILEMGDENHKENKTIYKNRGRFGKRFCLYFYGTKLKNAPR